MARSKPLRIAIRSAAPPLSSSRIRSKISTLASTDMPIVSTRPARPGSVNAALIRTISASTKQQVEGERDAGHEAGEAVVDDHEDDDRDAATQRIACLPCFDRLGAERGADDFLADRILVQLQRQAAGLAGSTRCARLRPRDMLRPLIWPLVVDRGFDARRAEQLLVEDDAEVALSVRSCRVGQVLAGQLLEAASALAIEGEVHGRAAGSSMPLVTLRRYSPVTLTASGPISTSASGVSPAMRLTMPRPSSDRRGPNSSSVVRHPLGDLSPLADHTSFCARRQQLGLLDDLALLGLRLRRIGRDAELELAHLGDPPLDEFQLVLAGFRNDDFDGRSVLANRDFAGAGPGRCGASGSSISSLQS